MYERNVIYLVSFQLFYGVFIIHITNINLSLYTLKTKRLFLTEKQLVQYQLLITINFLTIFQLKITVIKTAIENKRLFLTEKKTVKNTVISS